MNRTVYSVETDRFSSAQWSGHHLTCQTPFDQVWELKGPKQRNRVTRRVDVIDKLVCVPFGRRPSFGYGDKMRCGYQGPGSKLQRRGLVYLSPTVHHLGLLGLSEDRVRHSAGLFPANFQVICYTHHPNFKYFTLFTRFIRDGGKPNFCCRRHN